MKKILFLFLLYFATTVVFGQKADFRAAAKFNSSNLKKMVGSTSVNPVWLKDSDKFWYSYKTGDGRFYWFVDPAKKTRKPLFDNYYMASEINQKINKIMNASSSPRKKT